MRATNKNRETMAGCNRSNMSVPQFMLLTSVVSLYILHQYRLVNSFLSQTARDGTLEEPMILLAVDSLGVTKLHPTTPSSSSRKITRRRANEENAHAYRTFDLTISSPTEAHGSIQNRAANKFFVMHIGPSKTGTSTIQKDSGWNEQMKAALASDGVVYIGKFDTFDANPRANATDHQKHNAKEEWRKITKCMAQKYYRLSKAPIQKQRAAYQACWPPRWKYILQNNLSVVDSCEGYSYKPRVRYLKELKVVLQILGFEEIILVGAYRRYAEWMISGYGEWCRQACLKHPTYEVGFGKSCANVWDYMMDHVGSPNFRGRYVLYNNIDKTLDLGASWNYTSMNRLSKTSSTIPIDSAGGTNSTALPYIPRGIDLKLLTYMQDPNPWNSITTEFYCKALGPERTPNACRVSRDRVEAIAYRADGNYNLERVFYDHIANAMHDRGYTNETDTNIPKTRIELRTYLMNHHRNITRNQILGLVHHLPLVCPPRGELAMLLEKSLNFEELVMTSPVYMATKEDIQKQKEKHVSRFWETLVDGKKTFCSVDTERLFGNATSIKEILDEQFPIFDWDIRHKANHE